VGKLNFRGYLISLFFPTREIRENLMHAKNMCFAVSACFYISTNRNVGIGTSQLGEIKHGDLGGLENLR